jgi:hypothetical protein
MFLRYLGLVLSGLKTFVVRYVIALGACGALWWLLHVLRPCEESTYIGPPECSVVERTADLQFMDWSDWIILAILFLGISLLWTVLSLAFCLWRTLENAMQERGLQPMLGGAAICSLAFAICVVVDQLASGLRPCFGPLVERPALLFGCYIMVPEKLPVWPSSDLTTYVGLAILALVIVGARFTFRRWRRG